MDCQYKTTLQLVLEWAWQLPLETSWLEILRRLKASQDVLQLLDTCWDISRWCLRRLRDVFRSTSDIFFNYIPNFIILYRPHLTFRLALAWVCTLTRVYYRSGFNKSLLMHSYVQTVWPNQAYTTTQLWLQWCCDANLHEETNTVKYLHPLPGFFSSQSTYHISSFSMLIGLRHWPFYRTGR